MRTSMMNTSTRWLTGVAALMSWAALGCSNGGGSGGGSPCAGGSAHTADDGWAYCSYRKLSGPVQETGFQCPPDMPNFFEFGDEYLCAGSEQGLPGWVPAELPNEEPPDQDAGPTGDAGTGDTVSTAGVAIDILFVIDNSASMCDHQQELADGFVQVLSALSGVDFRIAVVTTDGLTDGLKGAFQNRAATEFPFACSAIQTEFCVRGDAGDALCIEAFGGATATCDAPEKPKNITNCNGSLNSKCRLLCSTDAECDAALVGADAGQACTSDEAACAYKCLVPSGDLQNSGCVLRPKTDACPAELPTVLDPGNAAELFPCIGVVGAEQHNNASLEQGLNAAWSALDPAGPNPEQATSFLRESAALLVVFVSDEDDCSVAEGASLKKEQYGTCTCLPDETIGGDLVSPPAVAAKLQGLKASPDMVFAIGVIGDSLATTADAIAEERMAFQASKCSMCADPTAQHPLLFNTSMCTDGALKADLGRRYLSFLEALGDNGQVVNVCSNAPIGANLGPAIGNVLTAIAGGE